MKDFKIHTERAEHAIEIMIIDGNGETVFSLDLHEAWDGIGDITRADIGFREDIYVNGRLWLDGEVSDKK